jgi:glycosylphosphatidylinositol phospholipase D
VYLYSGADGGLLWTVDGKYEGGSLGMGLGKVGLLDKDAAPDLVAAAPRAGKKGAGEAYVLSGATGRLLHRLKPPGMKFSRQYGNFFASGPGDINADGVPDIFIGDYSNAHGGEGSGRVYIYSGASGSLLRIIDGENGEGLGPGRGVGDVNGDGFGDLYIGAYTNSEVAPTAGKGYLFSGKNGGVLRTMTGTQPSEYLGVDALGVGDVNGDGKTDYLLTGVNFDLTGLDHSYLIAGK